jgi:hypothetical protein
MESTLLPRNEGTLDRVLRVILGLGLLSIVFVGPQTPWGWVGLVPLVTGLVGSCPLYRLFGLRTCPIENTTQTGTP